MVNMDEILKERATPQAPSNLAYRIAEAAQEKDRTSGWWKKLECELSSWIFIPRPAYVMALFLLFGMILGFELGGTLDIKNYDMASFMDVDIGDWS